MTRFIGASLLIVAAVLVLWPAESASGQEPGPWPWGQVGLMNNYDCLFDPGPCNSLQDDCLYRTGTCYFCRMFDPHINRWCVRRVNKTCLVLDEEPTPCGLLTRGTCATLVPPSFCDMPYDFLNDDTCYRWRCNSGGG